MITIDERAKEQSTFVVTVSFFDEDDAAVVPNTIEWSLIDRLGNIINMREGVSVAVPAAEIDIVLSGDDLQILSGETDRRAVMRSLVIEATYDSSLGTDLPLIEVGQFVVTNFPLVE